MTGGGAADTAWTERAATRSPSVQRSRVRSVEQARQIVDAARRLVEAGDEPFTTQQLIREAGVALQTFYRYFGGKDELLLALLEEIIAAGCADLRDRAAEVSDPLDRLRLYVTGAVESLGSAQLGPSRFVTSEHYRLHQLFPDELDAATRPFVDLLRPEIEAAAGAGLLRPADVDHDAWFICQLSMSTFHHFAFVTPTDPIEVVAERLWQFCLRALGHPDPA